MGCHRIVKVKKICEIFLNNAVKYVDKVRGV